MAGAVPGWRDRSRRRPRLVPVCRVVPEQPGGALPSGIARRIRLTRRIRAVLGYRMLRVGHFLRGNRAEPSGRPPPRGADETCEATADWSYPLLTGVPERLRLGPPGAESQLTRPPPQAGPPDGRTPDVTQPAPGHTLGITRPRQYIPIGQVCLPQRRDTPRRLSSMPRYSRLSPANGAGRDPGMLFTTPRGNRGRRAAAASTAIRPSPGNKRTTNHNS